MTKLHHFNSAGYYTGTSEIPVNPVTGKPFAINESVATLDPLPAYAPEAERVRRIGGAWVVEAIPAPEPDPEPIPDPVPEPEPETLEQAKARVNSEINAARLAANRSTFLHAGKEFACDELSRSDIDGTNWYVALYGELPLGWPGGWKAVDNTYLPIEDVAAWKAFYTAMFAAGSANFAKAQMLKEQLAAATTLEEVYNVGW